MKKIILNIIKAIVILIILLILVVGIYAAYVFIDYHRIGDKEESFINTNDRLMTVGSEYSILSWNIGFASYSKDFSFFMDGGKSSRAYSKKEVYKNLDGIISTVRENYTDFLFMQETDVKAHRSHKVNERDYIFDAFSEKNRTFTVNYDSPYLFYPITSPHGKSLSGLLTMSDYEILSSYRVGLPIESGIRKILDLDRCYDKIKIAVEGDKTLVLYNVHLSAYTKDGTISTKQLEILLEDMQGEYNLGSYIIGGGDFNKDLLGDSSLYFGVSSEGASWAKPFPEELLNEHFRLNAGKDAENKVPSCRNCDTGYIEGKTFVTVVDGFITSDNITVNSFEVLNAGFENSDHNPVKMKFVLN